MTAIDRRGFLGLVAAIVLAPAAVLGLKRRPDGILIECDTSKFGALGQEVSLKLQHGNGVGKTLTIEIPRARIVEGGLLAPAASLDFQNRVGAFPRSGPDPWPDDDEVCVAFT